MISERGVIDHHYFVNFWEMDHVAKSIIRRWIPNSMAATLMAFASKKRRLFLFFDMYYQSLHFLFDLLNEWQAKRV